jgi:CheY-like chemotaxis protein
MDRIVTDVMMPVVCYLFRCVIPADNQLDGFGLLNALKQDKQLAMLPVIMLYVIMFRSGLALM